MFIAPIHKKHIGFTLVETMIALVANLVLFAGLMLLLNKNLEHYEQTTNTNRLHEQLQSAMQIITSDIRRAGYWGNAKNDVGTGQNNNPFVTATTNISINASGNCILLSYDRNSDGSIPAISSATDDERYGYRLNNGAIQARPAGALFDCAASSTSWENMTDPTIITITTLTFTPTNITLTTGPGTRGIVIRSVDVVITGQLVNNTSVTKTLTEHVRIRNDKFIP